MALDGSIISNIENQCNALPEGGEKQVIIRKISEELYKQMQEIVTKNGCKITFDQNKKVVKIYKEPQISDEDLAEFGLEGFTTDSDEVKERKKRTNERLEKLERVQKTGKGWDELKKGQDEDTKKRVDKMKKLYKKLNTLKNIMEENKQKLKELKNKEKEESLWLSFSNLEAKILVGIENNNIDKETIVDNLIQMEKILETITNKSKFTNTWIRGLELIRDVYNEDTELAEKCNIIIKKLNNI